MKLIRELTLIGNKKLIFRLNLIAFVLMVLFFGLFFGIATIKKIPESGDFSVTAIIISLVGLYGLIVIHELIHGLFFKLFNPEGKVKFGYKQGVAYATSPNSFYSKAKFSVIALAPFIVINSTLLILYFLSNIPIFAFVFLSAIHAASCIGDFYYIVLILQSPPKTVVEDTELGINFYQVD